MHATNRRAFEKILLNDMMNRYGLQRQFDGERPFRCMTLKSGI